jgi:hypothetical protein
VADGDVDRAADREMPSNRAKAGVCPAAVAVW